MKRIISITLCMAMVAAISLPLSMGAVSAVSAAEVEVAAEIEQGSSINQYFEAYDKKMLAEGYILEKRSFEIEPMPFSELIESGTLSPYEGYGMRYKKVASQYNKPWAIQGMSVRNALNTVYNVAVGATKAYVWIPATILGIGSLSITGTSDDMLSVQEQIITHTYFMEIEDKDNKVPGEDYYPYSSTEKKEVIVRNSFIGMKDGLPFEKNGSASQTFYSTHYGSYQWMKEMAYMLYKNQISGNIGFELV